MTYYPQVPVFSLWAHKQQDASLAQALMGEETVVA